MCVCVCVCVCACVCAYPITYYRMCSYAQGKMWNKEDKLQDTKCLIPDRFIIFFTKKRKKNSSPNSFYIWKKYYYRERHLLSPTPCLVCSCVLHMRSTKRVGCEPLRY